MNHIVHQEQHGDYVLKLVHDDCAMDPREDDNLGTMFCGHRRYNLGDVQFNTAEALDDMIKEVDDSGGVHLPLYLYDHSGITMSVSPFYDRWDSGLVGIIYVRGEKIKEEYGELTAETAKKARDVLLGEVETYDFYISGQCYGFIIEKDDEEVESCWGFLGYEYAMQEAKSAVSTYNNLEQDA